MEIALIGGFLGAGKTTVLNQLLRGMDAERLRVAVIENEIGTTGIDDKTLQGAGVHITPLFGGCICCQISGAFLEAVREIQDTIGPDWLLVELTGLALMDEMRASFREYGDAQVPLHTLAVADAARWDVLRRACEQVIRFQLADADVVLLNKTDLRGPDDGLLAEIQSFCRPGAPIIPISAVSHGALWATVRDAWRGREHGE